MSSHNIWNLIQPRLDVKIKDKYNARKIKNIMKGYILSDETVQSIKSTLQNEMTRGLDGSQEYESLPMKITFVTDRYNGTEIGNFVSICAHSQNFTITLVKLKPDASPEIHKKHYSIDSDVFKKPYIKIYDAFAKCVKKFFIEHHLDGEIIPTSFCTDLYMEQYSLDTAIIPHFIPNSKMYRSHRDVKASFERVFQKEEYQNQADLVKMSTSDDIKNIIASSDTERSYHALFDAKLLGTEYVKGLEVTLDICHNLLAKFQKLAFELGEPIQKILLEVSHAGVKVLDKIFKTSLHHHSIHKISHVVLDFKNPQVFGYLHGDFIHSHQFFGFKTDRSSTEVVSLLRNIFITELIRKKKEKLEMQASQVFIILKNFLTLAHELKFRELEIPRLLQQRVNIVKNINWWLEGSFDEPKAVFEEPQPLILNVRIQDLYAAACHIKHIEFQREEAERIRLEKLAGKPRRRRKKKAIVTDEDLDEEAVDPLLVQVSDIFAENVEFLESILKNCKENLITIQTNLEAIKEFDEVDSVSLKNVIRSYLTIFNLWIDGNNSLIKKMELLISTENLESEEITYELPIIYTGKKQHLQVTKKLFKGSIFEDTDFEVPNKIQTVKSELLNKFHICEKYFCYSLKMRREEMEDLNYFISDLHFRESIAVAKDSKAVEYCRRLLVKAAKMRLKEIHDIEEKLDILKESKIKIFLMIPNTIKCILDQFRDIFEKRRSSMDNIMLTSDIFANEENVPVLICHKTLIELKMAIESDIKYIKKELTEMQGKEQTFRDITNMCFLLYNQTFKLRKKEFDEAISDLDMFDSLNADASTDEDRDLVHFCQEEYLIAAGIREKEMQALEFEIKSGDKKFQAQDFEITVTLKDLFHTAVEMEKYECEKILQLTHKNDSSDKKILPVVHTFKDLHDVVTQYLKKTKSSNAPLSLLSSLLEDPHIYTSLREFLIAAFEVKQKEIEIPVLELKKDLESVLTGLINDVKRRQKEKQLKCDIHQQALKISNSWKEVFLLAIGIREKEMKKVITSKKKEIKEEEAILKSLKEDYYQKVENVVNYVVKTWRKIFSVVVRMKEIELEKVNEVLKKPQIEIKELITKSRSEYTSEDDEDEGYFDQTDLDALKEDEPSEEILKAIASCKKIYDIAIDKLSTQLEDMEHEMRSILTIEYDEVKHDLQEDEITTVLKESTNVISEFIVKIKAEVSSLKTSLESLNHVEDNIKSMAASAKSTSTQFLNLLLELEENAIKTTEEKINQMDNFLAILLSDDDSKLRPFTDLIVDVMSEEETEQELQKKDESESQKSDDTKSKLTSEEIESFLFEVNAELQTVVEDKQKIEQRKEILDAFESMKSHLELASEMRRESIESISLEMETLTLPDPKKQKAKEKVLRALNCIGTCKEIFLNSMSFRQSEVKILQSDVERIRATENIENIVVEIEPLEIIGSCRTFFLSAVEARRKNISMMKNEIDSIEMKKANLPRNISVEARTLIKSEIYSTCKDLVLESVDLKMKEIDDISSQLEALNNIELKVTVQLKQLNPDDHKSICAQLEKVKDAVATCKKLYNSASETAKKEVKDTDKELGLLRGALQSSETSLITATCKNLLLSAIEKKELEVKELENELHEAMKNADDILFKFNAPDLNQTSLEIKEESSSDDQIEQKSHVEHKSISSVEKAEAKDSFNGAIDIEEEIKMKASMVTTFLMSLKEALQDNILKIKEEITSLEADFDKIKLTAQKVEGEDSQVLGVCQRVFIPIFEMRHDEIKSFESELKILKRISDERSVSLFVKEKTEESEVDLAITSFKRVLNLAIKNRKSEKDAVDFELTKLVRFQDSRITNMCKQFLLTTLHKSSVEMGIIKTKLLKIESIPLENESEILTASQEVLQSLLQATKKQIDAFISDNHHLIKKKMQMEIEESQFLLACKEHFSLHQDVRKKEISVMRHELYNLAEDISHEEVFHKKIVNAKSICKNIWVKAVSVRKKEIENLQLELIKHYDIKVSVGINLCKNHIETNLQDFRNELKMLDTENEDVLDLENLETVEMKEIHNILLKLQKLYASNLKKRKKDALLFGEMFKTLHGKKADKEKKSDVKAALKPEACFEKLKTDASLVISACKEILYSIIEVSQTLIEDAKLAMDELKRQETDEGPQKKKTFTFQEEDSRFTEKELALLEALEQDIVKSEATAQNIKVKEFCSQLFLKSFESQEILNQSTKRLLDNLSGIEREVVFEASKVVHFMINLIKSIFDEQVSEKHNIQNSLQSLEEMKTKEINEEITIINSLQEMLADASSFKKEIIAFLKLSLESLQKKEEHLKYVISKVYNNCSDLLLRMLEMTETDIKHLTKDLDSLKQFPYPEDEEESKLSEDEKAVRKCRLFFLAAIDQRNKLVHSITLELKFLEASTHHMTDEDSRIFPTLYERFLTLVGLPSEDISSKSTVQSMYSSQAMPAFNMKIDESEARLQELQNFKHLLESLEQKRKKQPIYAISSWNDLFLRSFLNDQIEKCSLDQTKQQLDDVDDIMRERNWEELFHEADDLVRKQTELAIKLKESKKLFIPISSWSEIFMEAVSEWNVIMKKETQRLQNENLLLQWSGKMKSEENLAYSSGCKYGLQSTKFHQYANELKKQCGENVKEVSFMDSSELKMETSISQTGDISGTQTSKDIAENNMMHNILFNWDDIFSKCIDLIEEDHKAFNFMRKKNTKLQSQVISIYSSWDELFFKAVEKQKFDLHEEIKESNILKCLANSVNEEVQGTIKEHTPIHKVQKFDSWIQLIYDASMMHRSELLDALSVKRIEIGKSSGRIADFETESADHAFLTLEPYRLIDQGRKLLTDALKMRKNEIKEMENELKSFQSMTEGKKSKFTEVSEPVIIWKLIVSIAMIFKTSGQKFEHETEKHFNESPEDLFAAAMQSKLKEIDSTEEYWRKFTEKQYFIEITPTNISWSEMLNSISWLAKKDILKMAALGIKTEPNEKELFDAEVRMDHDLNFTFKALEDSACWMDLVLGALKQENNENFSKTVKEEVEYNSEESVMSWDEIFFLMSEMSNSAIQEKIFTVEMVMDHSKLKGIRRMVSSQFFSWDALIIGVIEEMLWAINLEEGKDNTISNTPSIVTFLTTFFSNLKGSGQANASLKDILKKLGLKSFTDMLPSEAGAKKIAMVDVLNETRKKVLSHETYQRKEFTDQTIWKYLFPIAVEVWHKKMEIYLDFDLPQPNKNSEFENLHLEVINSESAVNEALNSEQHYDNSFNSLQSLEKLIAYEYLKELNIQENFSEFVEEKDELIVSIKNFPLSLIDDMKKKFEDGKNLNPEYFRIPANWYELFKAGLLRYKHFLKEVMDLKEIEIDCLEFSPSTMSAKPGGKKKLDFCAANVLKQEVTLEDLFEIVDLLKKEDRVVLKEIKKDVKDEDAPVITSDTLEVSKVIQSFAEFFLKAYKSRLCEKSLMEQELKSLTVATVTDCQNYRVYPVLMKLEQYYKLAEKRRVKETCSINLTLENLNEFKDIFAGYLECPVTESLLKRNARSVVEINSLSCSIEKQQVTLIKSLKGYFDSLMSTLEFYFKRRKADADIVNLKYVNELGNDLEFEHQETFASPKKIFLSVINSRKEDILSMQEHLGNWNKLYKSDDSVENAIHVIILSSLKLFGDEMVKKSKEISSIRHEIHSFKEKKTDIKSKIALVFTNCKDLLLSNIEDRRQEILVLKTQLNSVKFHSGELNSKTAQIISLCEETCKKLIKLREDEIKLLEEYVIELNAAEITQVQFVIIAYFSQACDRRKIELRDIEELIANLDLFSETMQDKLSEAIDEALADIVALSSGKAFFHSLTEKKEDPKEKADPEVLNECLELCAKWKEKIMSEIKTMEDHSQLLKVFKGDAALKVVSVIDEFEHLLDNGLQSLKASSDKICSEQEYVKKFQSRFYSEILEHLVNCRKHTEENISEIEQDIYVLQLQLSILGDDYKDMLDLGLQDLSSTDSLEESECVKPDTNKIDTPSIITEEDETVDSKESSIVRNTHLMLNSSLEFRLNYIDIFSSKINSLTGVENKVFEVLTGCTENATSVLEKRELEKQNIEDNLLHFESVTKSDVVNACMERLNCILGYDKECLYTMAPDISKLKSTIHSMKKKRSTIFDLCKENFKFIALLSTKELENMKTELVTMECMRTSEDTEYVTSSKSIFETGVADRKTEILMIKDCLESVNSETEIPPIVDMCRQHFQNTLRKRKDEIYAIEEQIKVLEREAPMLLLVFLPALEGAVKGNQKTVDLLIPFVQKLNGVSRELKTEGERVIEACLKIYCHMLETFKIEREAIKHDVISLKQVELEKKDIIDTEGKEVIVSFKDLYLAAFNMKQTDLEKDIRKKNMEENVKIKIGEIIQCLGKKTVNIYEDTLKLKSSTSSTDVGSMSKHEEEESILDLATFEKFVGYYDIKKEERRSRIEEKIMNEFDTIEKAFAFDSCEGFDMDKLAEEDEAEEEEEEEELDTENKSRTQESFKRMYEIKMKEVEEDIALRQSKMSGVINMRKYLMEEIVSSKKKELEKNISLKEKEMRDAINSIKEVETKGICSLRDLFGEIFHMKSHSSESPLLQNMNGQFVAERFQSFSVSVKLEKFIDIVLEIKKAELRMMLQSKYKDVDKIISVLRREIDKIISSSKEKLEEALKNFRRSEKAKAVEYAISGFRVNKPDDYVIKEEEIFPDLILFRQYAESFKGFFVPQCKKVTVYRDKTFRSEEILESNPSRIPLFRANMPSTDCVSLHILNLLEVEINSLLKILSEMNLDKAKAILHGLSFISVETDVHNTTVKRVIKDVLLDIVTVLNDSTSMLMLGSFNDKKCDISLNLDKDCNLVYFEKTENIKKWSPVLENVNEVAVDIGLKHFGKDGSLLAIATKFDWAVTTVPIGPSLFERFISDIGLLEQIKFAFLELHHHHLLCRKCDFINLFEDFGLSFNHVSKILSSNYGSDTSKLLPLRSGTPSADDVTIANFVCRIVLTRGALLTAVCLSAVLEKIKKNEITVITTSFFIQESDVYRKVLNIFLSYLNPGKKINFIYCSKSECGVGASLMASVANRINSETPNFYLLELEQRLENRNKLFSVQSFLKLLSDPTLSLEAEQLAVRYLHEMKFDLPLAVIWAYRFINGNIEDAENLFKCYHISLSKVSYLVCQKIALTKNLDLANMYLEFLKKYGAEQQVKESAYKVLVDLLFYEDKYEEAVSLVEECIDNKIPLTKLRHSTLTTLHDFCVRESGKKGEAPSFPLPVKDFDTDSSDSDTEERATDSNYKQLDFFMN